MFLNQTVLCVSGHLWDISTHLNDKYLNTNLSLMMTSKVDWVLKFRFSQVNDEFGTIKMTRDDEERYPK